MGRNFLIDLSIVIVNWNTSDLLIRCLDSIYCSDAGLTFEVIVVDNASTDDSVKVVNKRFPQVRVIVNDQNLGFAKANNQGIKIGKGRYFLLLNSDTFLKQKSLDMLVHYAEEHLEAGVIGPKLLNIDDTLQESWAEFPTFWSEIIGKPIRKRHPFGDPPFAYEVDSILGACMLVRSEIIHTIGMLDEEYFMYSEEIDWCYRIKMNGWRIHYYPAAEIYHIGGASASMNNLRQLSLLYQNKIRFFSKNYGYFQAFLLRYGLALANFIGIIRRLSSQYRKDKKSVLHRVSIQLHLIWCLLRNKYPIINP
jgi:GT2 family glycosyltransferase